MIVRKAIPADAFQLAELMKHVEDSNFMLFEPGERKTTAEQLEKRLAVMGEDSVVLVTEEQAELTGYLFAIGDSVKRKRHSVYVAVGIRQSERGKGRGTGLFQSLDHWAAAKGIRRIELTVLEHNHSAIGLYQKMGFDIEGVKRDSVWLEDHYANEYYMAKLL